MQEIERWMIQNPKVGLAAIAVVVLMVLVVLLWGFRQGKALAAKVWTGVTTVRARVARTWDAAKKAWPDPLEDSSEIPRPGSWTGKLGASVRGRIRWVNDHLLQIVAWPATLGLAVLLVKRALAHMDPGKFDRVDLVLLGLVLGLAVLAQTGNDLLLRLKKVGPVEFMEERFARILPELEGIGFGPVELDGPELPLPEVLLWEYEKAEVYVTHLEWSGLKASGLLGKEKFHDLLFKMSAIAMMRNHWARAVDRLELLLKITEGRFKAADAHYRCGVAYRSLAELNQGKEKDELLRKAQDHLWQAVNEDPHLHQAYFNLAYVQVPLEEYDLALQNNEQAIKIFHRFARAKSNIAICYLKMGQREGINPMKEALKAIMSINPGDEDAKTVAKIVLKDHDLRPLLEDQELGKKAREHLDALIR